MRVTHLAEVQRQWTPAITDACFTHLLGTVQMTQSDIGDLGREEGGRDGLFTANDNGSFAGLGNGGAMQVGVAHGHQRLAGLPLALCRLDQLLMHPGDTGSIIPGGSVELTCEATSDFGRTMDGKRSE